MAVLAPAYLVDASVFIFRAYYSMPADMADADGRSVNALYGFARFLGDLLEEVRPAHVGVAFDESLTGSYRTSIYPGYKAQREPPPAELADQFARCRELCGHLGLASDASDRFEADDIIGTWSARLQSEGRPVVLVTRDKDLAQLIRPGDAFWDFSAGRRYAYADIPGRFGVVPERMADYQALTGDAVDNIPGVPGVGPKTAAVLMQRFATLEELYADLDAVPALPLRGAARVRERLAEHRDAAFLARELTRIARDAPVTCDVTALARRAPDQQALAGFYDRAGFGDALRRQAARIAAQPL